jgi:Glycosyl transferases group 1
MASLKQGSSPRVLAVLPGIIPSTALTVIKPLLGLEARGAVQARFMLEWLIQPRDLDWADILIFCRNMEPNFSQAFHWAIAQGKPYIYDIDDNFFDLPKDTEEFSYYNTPERQGLLIEYLTHAALVRVYSPPMLERVTAITEQVVRTPAPVDLALVHLPNPKDLKPLKIVYATSRKVDPLFSIFWPALQRILIDYDGRIEAHFWGFFAQKFARLKGIHYHAPTANYDSFLRNFSRSGFSIGLAPLFDTNFYRSKTNNKFREYGACRVAGIYSDVEVYRECVTDQETGILVDNIEESWYQAMVQLIEDENLRLHIQTQAEIVVREQYSEEIFESTWMEQIQAILDRQSSSIGMSNRQSFSESSLLSAKRPGILSQMVYQVKKAVTILRRDKLASVIERLWFKAEQIFLLLKITSMRRF